MRTQLELTGLIAMLTVFAASGRAAETDACAPLPSGVKAVWDLEHACREKTPARERVCLNGLWRWQPATAKADTVPDGSWGYFKVPGAWPGNGDYIAKDCQTVFAHPRRRRITIMYSNIF